MRKRKNGMRGGLLLLAAATLFLPACQEEYKPVEPPVIKVPPAGKRTLVETAEVYKDGKLIGRLRTFRLDDQGGVQVTRVYDLRNEHLGYITEDHRAFRRTAHGGHDLVANSRDQSKNVAAIFGEPLQPLTIKVLASAN